jgi:hypothetical protein
MGESRRFVRLYAGRRVSRVTQRIKEEKGGRLRESSRRGSERERENNDKAACSPPLLFAPLVLRVRLSKSLPLKSSRAR